PTVDLEPTPTASIPPPPARISEPEPAAPRPTTANEVHSSGVNVPGQVAGVRISMGREAMPQGDVGVATEMPTEVITPLGSAPAEVRLSSLSVEIGRDQPTEAPPAESAPAAAEPASEPLATEGAPAEPAVGPSLTPAEQAAEPVMEAEAPQAAAPAQEPAPEPAAGPAAEPAPAEPAVAAAAPPASLAARFTEVERAVGVLRRRYAAGGMTRDQLKEELRKLMILDENEQWWMIGLETDRWYKYDGKDWVLATPPGRAAQEAPAQPSASGSGFSFTAESTEPLPQRVPLQDDGATMVGSWASRLEAENKASGGSFDGGLTVPSGALDVTQPAGAAAWQRRLNEQAVSSQATVPSPAITPGQAGVAVPAPGPAAPPKPLQPDYGPNPGGLLVTRQQYGGCLIRLALVSAFVVLLGTCLGLTVATAGYFGIINRYEERITTLSDIVSAQPQSVQVFDAGGSLIHTLNDPNLGQRRAIPLSEISPYLIQATIATENERFYSDPGFDIIALMRAVFENVVQGGGRGGASTITQQLARTLVLDPGAAQDISIGRKIDEIIVASEIARRYSKSQILEAYLNMIYYGNHAYGIEAAARTYFGVPASQLDMAQASMLAGMGQAPALYDPSVPPPPGSEPPAIVRARDVRRLMVELGCIQMEHEPWASQGLFCVSQEDMDSPQTAVQVAMMEARMATFQPPRVQIKYPHFTVYVQQQLEEMFGPALYRSGFNVYTTLDPRIQDLAQTAVSNQIAQLAQYRVTNGAVLAMRPSDGAILAMVGSVDFNNEAIQGQVNITTAARQPGSALKPFVYLTAFERDEQGQYFTPATILWDVETCFGTTPPYCPINYDNRFHGPQTVRSSLANSYNIPAVKALAYVGLGRFAAMAERVGITFPLTPLDTAGLTAALGGAEVRMIDLVKAYAVLANNGQSVAPFSVQRVTRVVNGQEEVVFEAQRPTPSQQVEPGLAYLITSILSDNAARTPAFGANSPLAIRGYSAAVKTGTTTNSRDNWTVGYTPNVVVGVWVGNADGTPMIGTSGLTGAAPIWNAVMTGTLQGTPPQEFAVPDTVTQATYCADYGTADFAECVNRATELFFTANPPPPPESVVQTLPIDQFSGLIANENCPDYVENRVFLTTSDATAINWLNSTAEGQAWAQARNLKLPIQAPPTSACQPGQPRPNVAIISPASGATVSGLVEITGLAYAPGFNYEIQVASAANPGAFQTVDGPFGTQASP
ncbi:MAG: transglycosylase domain-containing protein, partial [Anaerolineae bacterium]|nr:transglycosylase domain-containing protein [Anaerolineae bacterium]